MRSRLIILLGCLLLTSVSAQENADSWTHFRGNRLNGISPGENIPVQWNDSTNIAWKTPIPGRGWSSPVVHGEQVWLTAATEGGKELRALCLDRERGKIIHNRILFRPDTLYRKHAVNTFATPTAAIEENRIYIHFGRYGTACLDTRSGETIWERTDLRCEHGQGPGSSLLIYKNKLIVHMEGKDVQNILALDKLSGNTIWIIDRPGELYDGQNPNAKKAYTTPVIVNTGGKDVMISNGAFACIAYDPESGKELWRIIYGADSSISMPTVSDGIVYFYMAAESNPDGQELAELLAVDPSKINDKGEPEILWRVKSPRLQLLTPLVKDGLVYTVDSKGIMLCLDASTGETIWSNRMKGKYHSSPVWAGGYLYFSSTSGSTYVVREGREMNIAAENRVEGEIWATPAIAGGALFLRTSKFLYKIQKP